MRARITPGFLVAISLVACTPTATEPSSTTSPQPSPSTSQPTTTQPLVPGCVDAGDFAEGGDIATIDEPRSDSASLGSISWDETDSCETFTFSFVSSEGAPATTPPSVTAAYVDDVPIVRVELAARSTVITDQLVETGLVERLYVVRALDGGLFVDLHLAAPAQAHVETSQSPAEVVLHLQPGIVEYPTRPAISNLVVIASPLDGALVAAEVELFGYARTFEANVLMIATVGDEVVAEDFTTAADSVDTWGEYRFLLQLPGGDVSVFVGDENPEDGGLEGIAIGVTVQE